MEPSMKFTKNNSPLLLAQYNLLPLTPSDANAVISLAEIGGNELINTPVHTSYFNKVFPTAVTKKEELS